MHGIDEKFRSFNSYYRQISQSYSTCKQLYTHIILFYDEIFNHLGRTYIDMKSENNDMT